MIAERIRNKVSDMSFDGDLSRLKSTASFGVASFPDVAKNREELIHMADKAMYRGKFTSKNIVFAAK